MTLEQMVSNKLFYYSLNLFNLFSDWPKVYSEFSKSAPVAASSCSNKNYYYYYYTNNLFKHVKDTQGHW